MQAPTAAQHWYAPGATWWLRRAVLRIRTGAAAEQAAQHNREAFAIEFIALLGETEGAQLAYPACFGPNGRKVEEAAQTVADSERADWINGAYGVCLRDFSARTCIRKSSLAAMLKAHLAGRLREPLSDDRVVAATQELSSAMTPFAPWERASGTPGKTVDIVLRRLNLGADYPYPYARAVASAQGQ